MLCGGEECRGGLEALKGQCREIEGKRVELERDGGIVDMLPVQVLA